MKKQCIFYSWIALIFLTITSLSSCTENPPVLEVKSPDGQLSVSIENIEGKVAYSIKTSGKELIGLSEISIFQNQKAVIKGSETKKNNDSWKPTWGQFSEIQNHYNELIVDVEYQDAKAKLHVRLYDGGVGLRYVIEGTDDNRTTKLICSYNLAPEAAIYSPSGEREPLGPLSLGEIEKLETTPKLKMPIVVEKADAPYLSILESDLFSAPGFEVISLAYDPEQKALQAVNEFEISGGSTMTPWRVILVNENLGDLVTNTVPLNLASPLKIENPNWIKPGKTLWDWRVHGFTAPDGFTYGINTESYMRFIDFAAEFDIDYFLIDDAWYTKVTPGHFELSDKLDLEKVIAYAKEKEVDLMLYYDRRHGEYGDEKLFEYYSSLNMKGIKYGFMGPNVPFTRAAIKESARNNLLIDFHDGPVPFTGVERTYPNAISREYCHAQQDSRRAFTPEAFIKMALINAIQGPLDMNNGNFDLVGINAGEREKGPTEKGSYISTVVSEAARTLIIYSGLVCIPDAPEAYKAKADLFEFIHEQPVGEWDESKVLNAKMGEYITTVRSHNSEWFVGSVYNQNGGILDIPLDFLDADKEYQVTYYEDTPETHCVTNPEAYHIRTGTVKKGDIVKAKIAPGGGHCMWIR